MIPTDLDTRVFRRAMPFVAESINRPDQPAYLRWWAAAGMPGLSISFPEPERILFHAGPDGPPFARLDSQICGLWRSDGSTWYLPDPITDDDLAPELEPIELA